MVLKRELNGFLKFRKKMLVDRSSLASSLLCPLYQFTAHSGDVNYLFNEQHSYTLEG